MMMPLIGLIIYYIKPITRLNTVIFESELSIPIFFIISGVLILLVITVQLAINKSVKKIAQTVGLGLKLERVADKLSLKMFLLAMLNLMASAGLLLTGCDYFSLLFLILMGWYFFQWPSPLRVSRMLKLKGDELEIVITRGEAFK